ncbi:PTS sugar transporter subunit IIB [Mammaliicoccus lentus]|uniref:PTS sugar transporter subunit IIB n=1 Tax=Mammaliicoccus lentus TaxID=42858 RepID=UPI003CE881FD
MKKAMVACRTGMGSSMMLKIKLDQVIKENDFPIDLEHDTMDALKGFNGDLIITLSDLVEDLKDVKPYVIGINNLTDKKEIQEKLTEYLDS